MAGSLVQQSRRSEDALCFCDQDLHAVLGIFSNTPTPILKTAPIIGKMIGVMFTKIFQIVPNGFGVPCKRCTVSSRFPATETIRDR